MKSKETTLFTGVYWVVAHPPHSDLNREVLPERSTFFRLEVYEMIGNSLVQGDERERKCAISVLSTILEWSLPVYNLLLH